MKRKNILFFSEKDFLTLPILRSLDKGDYRIFIIGPSISAVRFSRFCNGYFSYPQYLESDKDTILAEYANMVSEKYNIDVVIPLDLDMTLWVARNKYRLIAPSIPLSEADILLRLHNKWELTKVLDTLGILHPETILVENRNNLVDRIIGYPFMMKPLDKEAGQGIVKINNKTDLLEYCETFAGYETFPVLVQQYVDGVDIDMSLFAVDGKIMAMTIQRWNMKGELEFVTNQTIYDIGRKIITREKYSGFMHIDLRIDNKTQEIFVLECNPRAWGTMNASILAGVNFIDSVVSCVLGKPVESRLTPRESYTTFRKSFITLITKPWTLRRMSSISSEDLNAVLTDPIPYLLLAFFQFMRCVLDNMRASFKRVANACSMNNRFK